METLESFSSHDFYTQLFKSAEGVWSLGAVLGDRRIKVEIQNQSVDSNPTFNVLVGDLSHNDLILLFQFLSKNLSMDLVVEDTIENKPQKTDIAIFDEDAERWENKKPIEDVIDEKYTTNNNDDELVFSKEVIDTMVQAVAKDIVLEDTTDDDLDLVFNDVVVGVPEKEDIPLGSFKEQQTMFDKETLEEITEENITKDIEKAMTLNAIFELFVKCGYDFDDEEEVIEQLKEVQKQTRSKVLKGRRRNGLRTEWGKFWRDRTKTKGA